MIYKVKNSYVISSRGVWLPGVYDTRKTAKYASQFTYQQLAQLEESEDPYKVITFEDLKKFKQELNDSNNSKSSKEYSLAV